jgi:MipA family protein
MQQLRKIKPMALAMALAGSLALYPNTQAKAAGSLELELEVPTVIGLAMGAMPDYRGSDDYTLGVAPIFRYTFHGQERFVQLLANELTVNLLNDKMFRFGPLVNYHFGRTDDVDDEQVSRMTEIDDTVEAGAFVDIVWADAKEKRERFILGAKLFQDVGDESDGLRANISARYWHPVSKPLDLGITAGAFYQDDDYANHYFGVNAKNVGSSALPFFTANGGVNEYYVVVGGIFYLDQHWLMTAGVRGSVIAGDPADSPLVDQQGDSTQWMGGMGVGYAF